MKKAFKGKAIYNPSGKAGEYSYWACNFYVGCSNGCTYCYLKKGRGAKVLGGSDPKLKACFNGMTEDQIMRIFECELSNNHVEIQKHGLFFSFTTDPMIKETKDLTIKAVSICNYHNIPVKILTKEAGYLYQLNKINGSQVDNTLIAIGMTLTGCDDLEPNASSNEQRILGLGECKAMGFKTFASIEPIISFEKAKEMILDSVYCVDLYKIGLESGKKYDRDEAMAFVLWLRKFENKIYIKESLQKLTGNTIVNWNFVSRDYNIFI